MQRLLLDGPGALHWEDAPEPEVTDDAALVRPIAVATCDLDVGVLQGIYPLEGPYPFGHEGVADGTCTNVAVFLEDPALPLFQMYSRCCTLHTGRAHARPVIPEVLDLVAAGRFDPSIVTSEVVDWDDAAEALADPPMKLVVQRP